MAIGTEEQRGKLQSLLDEYYRACEARGITDEQAEARLMDVVRKVAEEFEANRHRAACRPQLAGRQKKSAILEQSPRKKIQRDMRSCAFVLHIYAIEWALIA